MNVTFPDSEYTKCIVGISSEKLQQAYEDKAERLVSKAENTLNINDYVNAMNYMPNVKDKDKRRGYEERLEIVKALIDEARKPEEKVDYSNFKWTYYKPGTGPASKIYKNTISYAIYAPEDVSALNGVSLPILIWLHGAGITYDIIKDGDKFLSRNIFPMLTNWDQYGLAPIPAIIIAPQAPSKDTHWSNNKIYSSIRAMIAYVKDKYNANDEMTALVGHSMGGGGALLLQHNMQGTFRTVVPMSFCCGYIGHAEEYYNLRMKGYDEECESEKIFKWMHHENDYTCLKGMKHEDVPIYAFTTDDDGDGESDLVHWLFSED
jgi:predicted peptidase